MAGLHGEMGAVQREVDEAKAAQDKLATGTEGGKQGRKQYSLGNKALKRTNQLHTQLHARATPSI